MSNIAKLRKQKKMTQQELAHRLGVAESTIRNWETSRSAMTLFKRVVQLCDELECDVRDLVQEPQSKQS